MSQHKSLTIQSEGFPATIETWNVLNDSVQHALGVTANIIGSNVILKGCDQYAQGNETYVTDGLITIDKQIYSFKGGKKTQGVTLIVEKTQAVYDTNSGNAKEMLPVYEFTYASNGGSGQSIIPWDSFVRVADLKELSALVPKVNDMYQHQILAKGYETHSFADVVEGTVPGHIRIDFDKELNTDDYILLISVESLLDTYASNAKHIIIVSSFDHKTTGFRVKASRKEVGERTQFKVHWIVFKK